MQKICCEYRKSQFDDKGVLMKSHLNVHGHLSTMINIALKELSCSISLYLSWIDLLRFIVRKIKSFYLHIITEETGTLPPPR